MVIRFTKASLTWKGKYENYNSDKLERWTSAQLVDKVAHCKSLGPKQIWFHERMPVIVNICFIIYHIHIYYHRQKRCRWWKMDKVWVVLSLSSVQLSPWQTWFSDQEGWAQELMGCDLQSYAVVNPTVRHVARLTVVHVAPPEAVHPFVWTNKKDKWKWY